MRLNRNHASHAGPALFGERTPAGALLGREQKGLAIDFANDSALVRWPGNSNQYSGNVTDLLTYTSPSVKRVFGADGLLTATDGAGELSFYYDPLNNNLPVGIHSEPARTAFELHCRDLTQSGSWTPTNVTPALDEEGIDGAANSASSLLATAASGTIFQSVTTGGGQNQFQVFVKRLVGTGTVEYTLNGGTNWNNITSTINNLAGQHNGFYRFSTIKTIVNASIGFRITTDTDKIAVDYCNITASGEANFYKSPILTTTAQVTRNKDQFSMAVGGFPWSNAGGAVYAKWSSRNADLAVERSAFSIYKGSTDFILGDVDKDRQISLQTSSAIYVDFTALDPPSPENGDGTFMYLGVAAYKDNSQGFRYTQTGKLAEDSNFVGGPVLNLDTLYLGAESSDGQLDSFLTQFVIFADGMKTYGQLLDFVKTHP